MTDIYCVTCVFKIPQTQLQLQYVSETAAREAYAKLSERSGNAITSIDITDGKPAAASFSPAINGTVAATDSYGAEATIDRSQLAAVMFEYVNRRLDARTEMELLAAHAQAKAQRRAASDPSLRTVVSNGSPIITPRQ